MIEGKIPNLDFIDDFENFELMSESQKMNFITQMLEASEALNTFSENLLDYAIIESEAIIKGLADPQEVKKLGK